MAAEARMTAPILSMPALSVLADLHFLRPLWLLGLPVLPLLAWWWQRRFARDDAWRGLVDAHLLPHLLESGHARRRGSLLLLLLAATLALIALAGPTWRERAQPLWQSRTPLVAVVDLSSAMLAADLPPSRMLQARAKLATLLRERAGGQVGLVAFADDAYTVAPLTEDVANIALFLDALAPDVMPVDGHRADRAIAQAGRLLRQAGFDRGDILLLTDHADAQARQAAADAARAGFRVSVLGLGTEAGAPYQNPEGAIAQAHLDAGALRALASAGDGRYVPLASDDSDLRALDVLDPSAADATSTGTRGRTWQDEGYWLLPPLMLIALFAFRRGAGVAALLFVVLLPWPQARAADAPQGTPWRRADQVEHARMEAGQDAYRAGDFAAAERAYAGIDNADGRYNHANALAKLGRYEDALAEYDRALRLQPGMEDAIANRRAVEAAMQRRPPQGRNEQQQRDAQGQGGQDSQSAQQAQGQAAPKPSQQGQQQSQQPEPQGESRQSAEQRTPADVERQRAADAAQRERMQRALEAQKRRQRDVASSAAPRRETPAERERRLANEAWLRRVPDDPGGLLRAKFRLEYERRQQQGGE